MDVKFKFSGDFGENLVGVLSELAAVECMRDTKIVCADGTLWWNSILLSQWSNVVR